MAFTNSISGVGEIADRLGVPVHRVTYIIRSRNVLPLLVIGGRRCYSEAAVQHIAGELSRIDPTSIGTDGSLCFATLPKERE